MDGAPTESETESVSGQTTAPPLPVAPLHAIFSPKTVAVIGATENAGSVGRTLMWNLMSSPFGGTLFPINPKRKNVLGVQAFPDILAVPARVDLALIATPAPTIPGIMMQCAQAQVRAAVIISAGFKELGKGGAALEQQVLAEARKGQIRIIGPNCLGVMNPQIGLNATFAAGIARPGNVAFLSQSGALCTAILDWSLREQVGFSAFVSTGSMLDIGWGDLIDYLGNDPATHSILIYMESIGDARSFLSAAREVALTKPIIVIKAGRTEAAAKAAASHTGALAGSDDVLDAAFRRSGVLRVRRISDLFYMAEVLARQPRPAGPRLTIVTNAGGPGVLATDALITAGGELAAISPQVKQELDALLPPHWSHNNPIDILGDAGPDRYAKALQIAAADPASDGLLVILTPQDMTDPKQTAEALKPYAKIPGKPVLASWMGGPGVEAGEQILNSAGIPTFPFPDTAAEAFQYMWRYTYNLRGLYETPEAPATEESLAAPEEANRILSAVTADRRTLLDEVESKKLMRAYGIPTTRTESADTEEAAVEAADAMGYPVVVKMLSKTITHKTDVGGVRLNLTGPAEVRKAFTEIRAAVAAKAGEAHFQGVSVQPMVQDRDGYEIILGSSIDPQFGPVMLFGTGGQLVEVFKDRSLAIPPLNATLARRMMEQTRIFKALQGVRGRKHVDLPAMEQLLVKFSRMIVEQRRIREIDINPLLVSPDRIIALDARVVLFPAEVADADLPPPAIRPYPSQYVTRWTMNDGTPVLVRPIRPEDEPLMVKMHQQLSDASVRLRYFHPIKLSHRVSHERLSRICFNDYDREWALVAEYRDPRTREPHVLGVGRLSRLPGADSAEYAILIADPWQHRGLGTYLLSELVRIARREKIRTVHADILGDNIEMQRIAEKVGFKLTRSIDSNMVRASIDLGEPTK